MWTEAEDSSRRKGEKSWSSRKMDTDLALKTVWKEKRNIGGARGRTHSSARVHTDNRGEDREPARRFSTGGKWKSTWRGRVKSEFREGGNNSKLRRKGKTNYFDAERCGTKRCGQRTRGSSGPGRAMRGRKFGAARKHLKDGRTGQGDVTKWGEDGYEGQGGPPFGGHLGPNR